MNVALALKAAREAKFPNQADAAKAFGVSQNTISCWERGETLPRLSRLRLVAKKLGLNYAELLRGYIEQKAAA